MKSLHSLLIIFSGHLSFISFSQTLHFPQEGMEQGSVYMGNWTMPGVQNISIIYIKDTVINSQTYSFFHRKGFSHFYTWNVGSKIYFDGANWDSSLAGGSTLLYDFNLNVGDTITVNPLAYFGGFHAMVDSAYMVTLLNGQQRRYIRLHNTSSPNIIYRWIDGIGDIDYGFIVTNDFEGGHTHFVCQKDSSGLLYANPNFNYDCDSLVNKLSNSQISITNCGPPHADCPTSPCDGHTHLCVTGGTPPYSYSWIPGGQTTLNLSGMCPGQYTLIATDSIGTTATASITISQPAFLTIGCSANPDTINIGDSTQLNSSTSGGTPPYSYYWSPPPALSNPFISNPVSGHVVSMCYIVTVTDANGCTDSCQVCVVVDSNPGINDFQKNDGALTYPNPFNTSATIEMLQYSPNTNIKFEMFDHFGREVKNMQVKSQKFEMQRGNLPSGIYFYKITSENKIIDTGKLVAQ